MRFFFKTDFKLELCTPKFFEDLSPNPSTTWPWSTSRAIQATYLRQLRKNWEQKEDSNQEMPSEKMSKKRFFCLMFTKKTGNWNNFPLKLWRNICPGPHRFLVFLFNGPIARKIPDGSWIRWIDRFWWGSFSLMQEKDKGIKFPVQGANETGHFQKKAVGVVFVFFLN